MFIFSKWWKQWNCKNNIDKIVSNWVEKSESPTKTTKLFFLKESHTQGKTNKKQNAYKNETQVKTQQSTHIAKNPR